MRLTLISLAMAVSMAAEAAAQAPPSVFPRLVFSGGVAVSAPASGGVLVSDYEPVLEASGDYSSHASQTLNVDRDAGTGVEIGAEAYLSRWFGIQAAYVYTRANLSGSGNSDYDLYLRYTSRQPPDYTLREYVYESSQAWPDTEGRVSSHALLLGAVVRMNQDGARVGVTLGGGMSVTRVDTRIESVAYTTFRLGGHSTLFPSQHRVVVSSSEPSAVVRPYLSGQLNVELNRRVALFGGIRVELGPEATLEANPESLVDPDGGLYPPDLPTLQRVLTLEPLTLPIARWRLVAGLRVAVG